MSRLLNRLSYFIFLFLFHLFGTSGTLNLVFGPVIHLAIPGAIPYTFTLGAPFEGLFSTFPTLEPLQKSLNTII